MSISETEELTYGQVWERIATLAEQLLDHPDRAVSAQVGELLDWIDAFHRDGLGTLVEMIRAWRGEIFLESVARDEVAGTLLAAYGLGEGPEAKASAEEAVAAALAEVRPYAESHGGYIDLESVVDGVVTIRMMGSCDGCPSSSATLTYGVEEALRKHWPDFRRLEMVDDTGDAAGDTGGAAAPEPVPAPQPLLQIRGHEGQ
ncbi:MAG TPA: NifU family protein [Acidimicrobiales bacterium]|nr:NifU family protein [Acidimicrobiales bacterium]